MDYRNNCRFIEKTKNREDVYILHFVFETKEQRFDGWKSLSFYRIGYVSEGEGVYRTQYGDYVLKKGDVFFGTPGSLYALQSIRDFQYYYIGYLGDRPLKLMEQLKINAKNCIFHGFASNCIEGGGDNVFIVDNAFYNIPYYVTLQYTKTTDEWEVV